MGSFDDVPDWANPTYKRRRILFVLLGISLAALSVGLYFLFTHLGYG